MLTKEQQVALEQVALRDGAYLASQTERGTVYCTLRGAEICVDAAEVQPSEIEQLKVRVAELEAALTRSR